MAKDTIRVTSLLPASPHDVYDAWLDSALHARMTGGAATIDRSLGGRHAAWDGYIEGRNVALEPGRRIVQTWRTSDFPADADDSTIEILLEAEDRQTRITIDHTEIPEGQGKGYESGWRDHYFRPMHEYFSDRAADDAEPVTEAMPIALVHAVYAAVPAPPSDEAPTVKLVAPILEKKKKRAIAKSPKKAAKQKASSKKVAPKKTASKKVAKPAAKAKKVAPKRGGKKTSAKKPAKSVAKKAPPKPKKKPSKSKAASPKRRR